MTIPQKNSILPLVSQLLANYPQLSTCLTEPLTFNLIIDTNVVIGDILWLTQKRENKSATTEILELIQNKTVIAYAPNVLKKEIKENIPQIAQKKGISEKPLLLVWQEYEKHITFLPYKDSKKLKKQCERDPQDRPFIALQAKHGYPVYSKDKDIYAMGGKIINASLVSDLKEYSRSAEISYSLKIVGMGSVLLSASTIKALFKGILRIPKEILGISLLVLFLLLLHEPSRKSIFSSLKAGGSKLTEFLNIICEAVASQAKIYTENTAIAENKKKHIIKHSGGESSTCFVSEL